MPDKIYYERRLAEERTRAEGAATEIAAQAHRELARLYEAKLARLAADSEVAAVD